MCNLLIFKHLVVTNIDQLKCKYETIIIITYYYINLDLDNARKHVLYVCIYIVFRYN